MTIDINRARENLIASQERQRKENQRRFELATQEAGKIIEMIIDKYAPQKIVQWGSLLNGDLFTGISDIDIAVEGIDSVETFFELLKDAETLTRFPLDIIQLEKIDPLHRETVLTHGKVVYEHDKRLA
jgi:predicted nucleotidyltransferase